MKKLLSSSSAIALLLLSARLPAQSQTVRGCIRLSDRNATITRLGQAWAVAHALLHEFDGNVFRTLGQPTCDLADQGDGLRWVAYLKDWDYTSCVVLKFDKNELVATSEMQCNGWDFANAQRNRRRI